MEKNAATLWTWLTTQAPLQDAEALQGVIFDLLCALYMDDDGCWDSEREWTPDTLDDVVRALREAGCIPDWQ